MYLNRKSRPADKHWIPKIAALVPVYVNGIGNVTEVHLMDGGCFRLGSPVCRVFKSIAHYYSIDLDHMRKHFVEATRKSQWVPLVIRARDVALFAFRARSPVFKNDGATGYIVNTCIDYIETVTAGKKFSSSSIRIHLTSGTHIHAEMSKELFEHHRHLASYFHYYLRMNEII